jgi:hypothetical protein
MDASWSIPMKTNESILANQGDAKVGKAKVTFPHSLPKCSAWIENRPGHIIGMIENQASATQGGDEQNNLLCAFVTQYRDAGPLSGYPTEPALMNRRVACSPSFCLSCRTLGKIRDLYERHTNPRGATTKATFLATVDIFSSWFCCRCGFEWPHR